MILKAVFSDDDIRRTIISNQKTLSAFLIDDVHDHAVSPMSAFSILGSSAKDFDITQR